LEKKQPKVTVLYSANFVVICPNCHREQLHTVGRQDAVYTCRWCERPYSVRISIQLTDAQGKVHAN
jgi:transposase-like protein